MPATPVWLAAFEAHLNRGLHSSAQALVLAKRLDTTALRLDVIGVTSIRAAVIGARLALAGAEPSAMEPPGERVDASISGSPLALLRLIGGPEGRLGNRRNLPGAAVRVRGDAEIANGYRQLFVHLMPDFEEELAGLVGDLPARRLSQYARGAFKWLRSARRTTGQNVAEYLQEESRDLVNTTELDEFLGGVDTLRESVDRLEARLTRLELRSKAPA